MAAGEVVEDSDAKVLLQEEAYGGSADVTCAAGDENVLLGHTVSV